MKQAKLASLYGNNLSRPSSSTNRNNLSTKNNNSEDCIIVEKPHSTYNHSRGVFHSPLAKMEDGERYNSSTSGTKRFQKEITSPTNDPMNSHLNDEEDKENVSGNGFVTARTKLVLPPYSLVFYNLLYTRLYAVRDIIDC